MWARISRARSASRRPRRKKRRMSLCDRLHDETDGAHNPLPLVALLLQLTAPFRGQPVEAGAAIVFRHRPVRVDPAPILEPIEGGIERPLLDLEKGFGTLL